tara:strand:+ start:156 stop:545 length:390 start_codon:yes stop_codon:yes gene_type:complete
MKKLIIAACLALPLLAGCDTAATVASRNLSKAGDEFELNRRIVFYNGITDKYMLVIEGRCSIDIGSSVLRVLCMTENGELKKHHLGLSDNVTYFSEQLDSTKASTFHYRVIFKPQSIIPNIDLETSISG